MRKNDVTFANVIADVRRQLSDNGIRIADTPISFSDAWWQNSPSMAQYPEQQLKSDHGIPSGPKQLNEEFDAEVKAIHECLDRFERLPRFAKWQETKDPNARLMYKSLNQRADALQIWEHIAFPLRRRGDIVFRIFAPRQVLGGAPMIGALHVDDFIRGVSSHTVRDKHEIARLRKQLNVWKIIAAGAIVVTALTLGKVW